MILCVSCFISILISITRWDGDFEAGIQQIRGGLKRVRGDRWVLISNTSCNTLEERDI